MFVLSLMKDTIKIPPHLFSVKQNDAIVETLNKKFANKVVYNLGLCVALWEVLDVGDSFVFPGDGSSHTIVEFHFIVFRPFIDEILTGKVKSASKKGLYVSMGFFDDIFIPADSLQNPSKFDDHEQLWYWEYATEDGAHKLYFDIGEEIRFRVVDEIFIDTSPSGPQHNLTESSESQEPKDKQIPYTIIASVSEDGLGLLSWWNS